jgi:hypothetical protein
MFITSEFIFMCLEHISATKVMIMSNCTIAMDEEYTFQTATLVLELHFFAMFSPGFYTGKFIKHR